ncbi:hypothetical protein DL771_005192 [Monosporascus sp. 5C6A]|nr:hypothetical protein DL771_005192 [Monosporascus sp. 5C6A]
MAGRQPASWDAYDRGASPGRSNSASSLGNQSIRFEEQPLISDNGSQDRSENHDRPAISRRRSLVTNRLAAITDIGGVNSIRQFSRSWQRAAVFQEVIPQRPNFTFAPDQEPVHTAEPNQYGRDDIEAGPRTSLLRQHLEAHAPGNGIVEGGNASAEASPHQGSPAAGQEGGHKRSSSNELFRVVSESGSARNNSIFEIPPHLATPFIAGSYGSYRSYGTIEDDVSRPSMIHAADLWRQQQESGANVPDGERPPILVKEVEQEGRIVLAVSGQSTLPQTVMNATNVLIGVGLLSLPMGLKYAGWICGMLILVLCALVTSWTAKILAKCMDLDPTMITFSDIAYISFGRRARIATSVLFTLELLAACVALIVLFADSLALLFPGTFSITGWKVLCALILIPLQFAPLSLLSFTSFIGIVCNFCIVIIVFMCGFLKPHAPGSLLEPAKTYLFPENWLTLPLSLGLLMSPWGGHGVFPNIYRDMRHPYRFKEAVRYTFGISYLIDASVAVVGLLMFGDGVHDEITANILEEAGYPAFTHILLVILIAIIPLTKIPLNAQPIITTFEVLFGLRQQTVSEEGQLVGLSSASRGVLKAVVRVTTLLVFLAVAVLFPAFDSIMAFMGSALCFTICVTLPLAFYLKLFGHEMAARERVFTWCVMLLSMTVSVVGTVWAFLPKRLIGAERNGNL